MRIEFLFTLDDVTEVAERMYSRQHSFQKARKHNILATGTFGALATLVACLLAKFPPTMLVFLCAVGFGCAALLELALGKTFFRKRCREALHEAVRSEGPFLCVVAIDESGIATTQMDANILRPWSIVESVDDCELGVEVVFRDGQMLIVRDKGFESPERKSDIIELARRYLAERGSEPSQAQA